MTLSKSELIHKYETAKEADLYWNNPKSRRPVDRWANLLLSECNMEELGIIRHYLAERISNATRRHQREISKDNS